ncbi:hypothetical protein JKP88DRAFT_168875 [Tribonema minus]|uniref:Hydro-lyase n=1 Tax=Tribonema minus TaxID=303371 RepID=A0A835YRT9_9STRA|nr:hypothetical protein JKP88DRAFT_168875 [Tribonema minus]
MVPHLTMAATAAQFRLACRCGEVTGPSCAAAPGSAQANLIILPCEMADDFEEFCQLNPKPCPLLEVLREGPYTKVLADGADIRTDLPKYRVYRHGKLTEEVTDIKHLWPDNSNCLVGFLLGCSFSFDDALAKAGLPPRHLTEGLNVPMYRTNVKCAEAGAFRGELVVSMRPYRPEDVAEVVRITERFPRVHGAPVAWGDPRALGIDDLAAPLFGDAVPLRAGEVPVFWACGATPQLVAMQCAPPLCVAHAPGHMFVADVTNEALAGPGG